MVGTEVGKGGFLWGYKKAGLRKGDLELPKKEKQRGVFQQE